MAEALDTIVYDANVVPYSLWSQLAQVHSISLKDGLQPEDQERADIILGFDSASGSQLEGYISSREDPNVLVGNSWNKDQLHKNPLVTVVYKDSEVVGGVLTSNNTSASSDSIPESLRPLVCKIKMAVPPGMTLPTEWGHQMSGKRYVHLREVYSNPNAREAITLDGEEITNNIVLIGLWCALQEYHKEQTLVTYIVPDDPADSELVGLSRAIGMQVSGESALTIPGYKEGLCVARTTQNVGEAAMKIAGLINTEDLHYDRRTKQSLKIAANNRNKERLTEEFDNLSPEK